MHFWAQGCLRRMHTRSCICRADKITFHNILACSRGNLADRSTLKSWFQVMRVCKCFIFFPVVFCIYYICLMTDWGVWVSQCMYGYQRTTCGELVLSFHHMSPGDRTHILRLDGKQLHTLRLLTSTNVWFFLSILVGSWSCLLDAFKIEIHRIPNGRQTKKHRIFRVLKVVLQLISLSSVIMVMDIKSMLESLIVEVARTQDSVKWSTSFSFSAL